MARKNSMPILLAVTVAGGLTLGTTGAAAAQEAHAGLSPLRTATEGGFSSTPQVSRLDSSSDPDADPDAVDPEDTPVEAENEPVWLVNESNNAPAHVNSQSWSYPQTYTHSETKNASPQIMPIGGVNGANRMNGANGAGPVQVASPPAAEEAAAPAGEDETPDWALADEKAGLADELSDAADEAEPERSGEEGTADEAEPEESDEDEAGEDAADEADDAADEGAQGSGPAQAYGPQGGPAAGNGGQLPFTGAPVKVALAGAGLLAVALAFTLLSARRRRSGAE